jgi:type II secretion system protein G
MTAHVRERGFTLIELLVVIAIIGVLSAVVLSSLNAARTGARDAKRKADLQQISKALELYYLVAGRYPGETACDSSLGSSAGACTTLTGSDWDPTSQVHAILVPAYIPDLPVDPVNDTTYYYTYEPQVSGSDYCLGVTLERGGRYRMKNGDTAPNC